MTTIISRLYSDTGTAHAVQAALLAAGHPQSAIDVVTGAAGDIAATGVSSDTAAAYAKAMDAGKALVVVRAGFNPVGAARNAMKVVDSFASIRVPGADGDEYIRVQPSGEKFLSILPDHPRFLSQDMTATTGRKRGPVSLAFGLRLLSKRSTKNSAMHGGGFMSTKFLPFPLLSHRKTSTSATHGGGTPLSTALGLPLIAKRV